MSRLKTIVSVLVCMAIFMPGGQVDAKKHKKKKKDHEIAYAALWRGEILPITEILEIATRYVPGEIIKIELKSKSGQPIYDLKVLTPQGVVQKLKLDARTGALFVDDKH